MFLRSIWLSFALISGSAASLTLRAPVLARACDNSPTDRTCWGDYDITTNYYDDGPDTGVVREYWFNVVNTTAAPDGIERVVLSINGSIPGPTIIADWGDTVVVHVTNSLQNNGTGIHFHGVRQNNTSLMDGVPSVTQCPIAPGSSYTYTWKATQYGSSWYHSHFYMQAWDGVFGGILINGPATANYDEDLGTLTLTDWSHDTADIDVIRAGATGPPQLPNALINGTNVFNNSGTIVGSRFESTFVSGIRYRLRLVNTAADTHFKFTIDNHTLEVIATDFVPINPYTTDVVSIGMGQRYDIIVTALAAPPDNYWIRAIPQLTCSSNSNTDDIKGIIRYAGSSTADPTSTPWADSSADDCNDEDMSKLVPYLSLAASSLPGEDDDFNVYLPGLGPFGLFVWEMTNTSFVNQWDYPTVQQAWEGNDTWTAEQDVFLLPNADEWVYWVIQTNLTVAHPLHLHGHDFWVLAQGVGTFDNTTTLTLQNAPRRDVVMLVPSGYVVIAFYTNNPGAWLFHCHIAWHTSEGLAVQILEQQSEFVSQLDTSLLNSTCNAWNEYVAQGQITQEDSGL